MLETHFGPCSALVWSSFMTFGCCAARSAALHGDASDADLRSSDVDFAGLPSLIGGSEGSDRSGSLRSLHWCIVIGRNQKVITRNRLVTAFLPFFRLAVSRIPMDGHYVTRRTRRFTGRFACFAGRFAKVSRVSHRGVRTFHAPFTHLSQRFAHVSLASYLLVTASLRTSIHPQSLPFDFFCVLIEDLCSPHHS